MPSIQRFFTALIAGAAIMSSVAGHAAGVPAGDIPAGATPPSGSNANRVTRDDYPELAAMQNLQGRVDLRALVTETGSIADAVVERSSGFPLLDEAAVRLVKDRFRYTPATVDGKPIAVWVHQSVLWRLSNDSPSHAAPAAVCHATPASALPAPVWHEVPSPSATLDVRMQVHISSTGELTDILLYRPSGIPVFDLAALQALTLGWQNEPVFLEGRAIACWAILKVSGTRDKIMSVAWE